MPGSDWSSSFYGNSYNLTKDQLNSYSQAISDGLEGGARKKKAASPKPKPKPKGRGFEAMTVTQLKQNAKDKKLTIPSKYTKKADIIAFMRGEKK